MKKKCIPTLSEWVKPFIKAEQKLNEIERKEKEIIKAKKMKRLAELKEIAKHRIITKL
jgi:hypothetical protein